MLKRYPTFSWLVTSLKLTSASFLLTLLFVGLANASPIGAQELLKKQVSIATGTRNLQEVLKELEENSEFRFSYVPSLVANKKATVKQGNLSLSAMLDQLLIPNKLEYDISGQYIIITKAKITQSGALNFEKETLLQIAQPADNEVSGSVKDEKGEGLPGVSVIVKGTSRGTTTDLNGAFNISVPNSDAILVLSFVGYLNQEVAVGNRTNITVTLEPDNRVLEELVVVGYGTQKKVNLTGAVEAVGKEVFENRSVSNTTQALQGAVPNLNLFLEDGKPTRSASFNVRGRTSIGQGGNALVLIDGVEGDPSFLNPNDIESVSVLKDAASAAIYGARGSFGVVLITTRRATKGKTTVNYSANFSNQSLAKRPEFVTDAVTWLEHFRESYYNTQGTLPTSINNNTQFYSDDWLERLRAWKASGAAPKTEVLPNGDYEYYDNVDWMGMLFKKRSFNQDHNLSISGGNDKADFLLSGRFYNFGGIYNYDPDTYRSYNLRAKGSLKAYSWLTLNNNMEFSNNDYHMPYSALGRSANIQRYIEVSAFPTLPMYNPDGTYTRGGASSLAAFVEKNNYQNNMQNLFRNTAGFNTSFFDNTFRINGDFTFRYNDRDYFWKRVKVPYYQNAKAALPSYAGDLNGIIYEWMSRTLYTASNLYAEYERTFSQKHYLKAMGGWNYETSAYKANSIQRNQLLLESAESVQLATGASIIPGASVTRWKTAGAFFRLNYGFKDRYLLEVNGRYDGSTRFPIDQQWGFFPSVSAAWRLTEEPFWKVNQNLVSDLKFRVSYGSLGNGNIAPYQFLELLSVGNSGRVLDGALNKSTKVPAPIPSGLTWERATTANFGLDLGMLQNKLTLNGDYYVRKTTDMYVAGPTLPDIFGAVSPKGNYADMTTKGFELSLNWQDKFTLDSKPFKYHVRAALFDYISTIDKYNNPDKRFTDHYDGKVIGELWGFRTDGLFQSDPTPESYVNTIFKSHADAVWRAGDVKISNLDGSSDNMITKGAQTVSNPGDMTIIGNTEPRYQYSFTLGGDWNGFFVSAFLHGIGRQHWYPGTESAFWGQYNRGYNQMPTWHLGNYWTEDNRDAYLPRYAQYNGALGYTNYVPNDRYLQRVSFLRLKNLQLGYSLPASWISGIGLKNARVYFSGENLASWSPLYKWTKNFMDVSSAVGDKDSDLNDDYNQGAGNSYPILKTYSMGISLTF